MTCAYWTTRRDCHREEARQRGEPYGSPQRRDDAAILSQAGHDAIRTGENSQAANGGLVLSSTLHFVPRLSVEGRLRPEGSEVEGRSTAVVRSYRPSELNILSGWGHLIVKGEEDVLSKMRMRIPRMASQVSRL